MGKEGLVVKIDNQQYMLMPQKDDHILVKWDSVKHKTVKLTQQVSPQTILYSMFNDNGQYKNLQIMQKAYYRNYYEALIAIQGLSNAMNVVKVNAYPIKNYKGQVLTHVFTDAGIRVKVNLDELVVRYMDNRGHTRYSISLHDYFGTNVCVNGDRIYLDGDSACYTVRKDGGLELEEPKQIIRSYDESIIHTYKGATPVKMYISALYDAVKWYDHKGNLIWSCDHKTYFGSKTTNHKTIATDRMYSFVVSGTGQKLFINHDGSIYNPWKPVVVHECVNGMYKRIPADALPPRCGDCGRQLIKIQEGWYCDDCNYLY